MKSFHSFSTACKKSLKAVFSLEKGNSSCQLIRFLLVGGLSAGLDLGLLILMVEFMFLHYLLAGLISYIIVVIFNYYLSRVWVFQGGKYPMGLEFLGFFCISVVGLGLNQLVLLFLVEVFGIHYQIAKLTAIMVVASWNFIVKKNIVFKS